MDKNSKTVIFLGDGMADEPLDELGGKTPLEVANTPNMDEIARMGASGAFLTLPEGYPTSSDSANLSVLGYDLSVNYPGRGPLEAASQGIILKDDEIAFRCNLVFVKNGILEDYSAGHIDNKRSAELVNSLQKEFGNDHLFFRPGVSYRNLLILRGKEFSSRIKFSKPDSSQGEKVSDILPSASDSSKESIRTAEFLRDLMAKTSVFLEKHELNKGIPSPANMIWPWSPGGKPSLERLDSKYPGIRSAVISAVDVIFGIALTIGMEVIRVPGATGFIDTNYKGKADAAINAIKNNFNFVYLHVEAIDECSHIGDLSMKIMALEDFDSKIVGPVMKALKNENIAFAVLPDHPVPVKLRKHTRTPVPVAICGPHIKPDSINSYSEQLAPKGGLGFMKGDQFMKRVLNLIPG